MSELRYIFILIIVIAAVVLLVLDLFGVFVQPTRELTEGSKIEIREFEGEPLSSIRDVRENSIRGPQFINESTYQLDIKGLVANPINYTYDEVTSSFPTIGKIVTLYCVEGWETTIYWEGVRVSNLIAPAGVLPDANTVIFYAYDGYTTSFPLDYITDRNIILAYRMNGVTLPPERGYPFMLVAEDKWGYKWIKWITVIELSNDPAYRGYWEQRGYSQSANLNESFFSESRFFWFQNTYYLQPAILL